jgi:Na+(H+)/acetate symporter ActP
MKIDRAKLLPLALCLIGIIILVFGLAYGMTDYMFINRARAIVLIITIIIFTYLILAAKPKQKDRPPL